MKTRLLVCLLILFGLGIGKASATAITWKGGSSSSWTLAANWLPAQVPGGTDDITIGSYTHAPTVDGGTPLFCNSITVTASATITLSQSLTVNTTFSANNSFNVTLATGSNKTLTITGLTTFYGTSTFTINASNTVQLGALNLNYGSSISNAGTVSSSGTIYVYGGNSIKNTTSTSSFTVTAGPLNLYNGSSVVNSGLFKVIGNINSYGVTVTNNSGATMDISNCTWAYNSGDNFTNSGTTYFYGNSYLDLTTGAGSITNNTGGSFYAGKTTGSACTINLGAYGSSLTNKANFYLSSTSSITFYNSTAHTSTAVNSNAKTLYNNGGTFIIESSDDGCGSIGPVASSSVISGTFKVQRYMYGNYLAGNATPSYRGYRLLSSPVYLGTSGSYNYLSLNYINNFSSATSPYFSNPVVNGFTEYGAFTGGPTGNTYGFSIANTNPTVYVYRENVPTPSAATMTFVNGKPRGIIRLYTTNKVDINDAGYTSNPDNTYIPVGNGYLMYYLGSNKSGTTPATTNVVDTAVLTATGTLNLGKIFLYLWYTPYAGSSAGTSGNDYLSYNSGLATTSRGFNMVGNPYACSINADQVLSDNSASVYNAVWELNDANPSQAYLAYVSTSGTTPNPESLTSSPSGTSQYIESGQGFIVQATGANKQFYFNEDQKVVATFPSTPLLNALPRAKLNALPSTNIAGFYMKMEQDTIVNDYCGIYFYGNWSPNYSKIDAIDLDGTAPKVYMSSFTQDGVRTAVNTQPDYTKGANVKLFVNAVADGIYKLKIENIHNIDTANYTIYLKDLYMRDSLNIGVYKSYSFNILLSDTNSFGGNRFVLALERRAMPPYNLIAFSGQKATGGIQLNWNTVNEGNYTSFGLEKLGANGKYSSIDSVQSNGSGIYNFNDQQPVTGNNIYRLAQGDIHGRVTFAGPININYNTIAVNGMFTIYPNPSKDIINIDVNSGITGSRNTPVYLASIYNLSGTVVDSRQVNTNSWTQDVSAYKAGVYILELKSAEGNIIGKAKFVKTN